MAKIDPKISLSEEDQGKQYVRMAVVRADFRTLFPRLYDAFDLVDQVMTTEVETMAVGPVFNPQTGEPTGRWIFYWNPNFTSQISDRQLIGVQIHELLHILLDHTLGRRPDLPGMRINREGMGEIGDTLDKVLHQTWGVATDYSINSMIEDWLKPMTSYGSSASSDPQIGIFPDDDDSRLPGGMSAEWYYNHLLDGALERAKGLTELEKALGELMGKLAKLSSSGVGSHGGWMKPDRDGTPQAPLEPLPGQADPTPMGAGEVEENGEKIEGLASDLQVGGLRAGTSKKTGGVYEALATGRERKTPGWMRKATQVSVHGFDPFITRTRKIPDRRWGLLFPGRKRTSSRNRALVGVDVSGSISTDLLKTFTEHLDRMTKYADFDVFFFNTAIIIPETGGQVDPPQGEMGTRRLGKGMKFYTGGGTDFEPAIRYWNRVRGRYDGLFIFTDGEATHSTHPIRPREVNWILYGTPYGTLVGTKWDMTRRPSHPLERKYGVVPQEDPKDDY